MSDILAIGNASQLVNDDVERDVNMQRVSPLGHKESDAIARVTTLKTGGHVHWQEAAGQLLTNTLEFTNTLPLKNAYGDTVVTDLTDSIPTGIIDIKGLLLIIGIAVGAAAAKVQVGTNLTGWFQYATFYGQTPGLWNTGNQTKIYAQVAGIILNHATWEQALVPVDYHGGIPYLTWRPRMSFNQMVSGNANYSVGTSVQIAGFLI